MKVGDQLIDYKIPDLSKPVQETFPPRYVYNYQNGVKVVDIIDEGRVSDTYCFNEPIEHKGIFNGILAGNCHEIVEYSDSNEYACCCLCCTAPPFAALPALAPQ